MIGILGDIFDWFIFWWFFRVIDLATFGPFEMNFDWITWELGFPQDSDDEKVKKKKKSGKAMKKLHHGDIFFKWNKHVGIGNGTSGNHLGKKIVEICWNFSWFFWRWTCLFSGVNDLLLLRKSC